MIWDGFKGIILSSAFGLMALVCRSLDIKKIGHFGFFIGMDNVGIALCFGVFVNGKMFL